MDEEQSFANLLSSTTQPARPAWNAPAAADEHDPWANPFTSDLSSDTFGASSSYTVPEHPASPSRSSYTSPYVQQLEKEQMVPELPSVIAARERERQSEVVQQSTNVYASRGFASPYESHMVQDDPFDNRFAPAAGAQDPALAPFVSQAPPAVMTESKEESGKDVLKDLIDEDLMAESDPEIGLRKAFKRSETPKKEEKKTESTEKKAYVFSPKKKEKTEGAVKHVAVKEENGSASSEVREDKEEVETAPSADENGNQQVTPTKSQTQLPEGLSAEPRSPASIPLPLSSTSTPVASRTHTPAPPKPPTNLNKEKFESSSSLTTPSTDRVSVSPLDAPEIESENIFKNLSIGGSVPYSAPLPVSITDSWTAEQPPRTAGSGRFGGKGWGILDDDDDDKPLSSLVQNSTGNGGLFESSSAGDWGGSKDDEGWGEPGLVPVPSNSEQTAELNAVSAEEEVTAEYNGTRSSPSSAPRRSLQPLFQIAISDPTRVGDPVRGYTAYTIRTRTSSPHYRDSSFSCLRRYSDFLWLFEQLVGNNPGVVIPPVPGKHTFGRFEEEFVETRRKALERFVTKITSNPILQLDPDLRIFLESDNFSYDSKERRAQLAQQTPATEKSGLLAGWTGSKYVEQDSWFEKRRGFLDSLEVQLKAISKAIEVTSRNKLELALSLGDYAESLTALSESDLGSTLSSALSQTSILFIQSKTHHETHAKEEVSLVLNLADEYVKLIGSVRGTWAARVEGWKSWQEKDKEVLRLRREREKLRQAGKLGDRVQSSLGEIAMSERKAKEAQLEFDRLTTLVKSEFARFERERVLEFKDTFEKYLEGLIEREKEMVEGWEEVYGLVLKMVENSHAVGQGD